MFFSSYRQFSHFSRKFKTRGNINFQSILFHLGGIAIRKSLPGAAVRKFLLEHKLSGKILLLSVGKAAEEIAQAAYEVLPSQIFEGIILTKYGHSSGKKFPKRTTRKPLSKTITPTKF
ncbi:PF13660 domain protein [Leptospira weilii str. Ecochallenge]|uniref:PF13660 domain protein n=1 Tax=Leptospira weilii str. Ecochallenge TaxID=1049986 RepID=N1U347_9LEPT|nr:PF13660 domain protein [Leptospira weilii str. Ecochallenge]